MADKRLRGAPLLVKARWRTGVPHNHLILAQNKLQTAYLPRPAAEKAARQLWLSLVGLLQMYVLRTFVIGSLLMCECDYWQEL